MTDTTYNAKQDPSKRQDKSDVIRDRGFEEQASLEFSFQSDNGTARSFTVRIPIFENPTINESKQARLGKYKPIGRNSNLYAFLGADSTTMSLSFNMTLPHIAAYAKRTDLGGYLTMLKMSTNDKDSFELKSQTETPSTDVLGNIVAVLEEYENFYLNITTPTDLQDFNKPETPKLGLGNLARGLAGGALTALNGLGFRSGVKRYTFNNLDGEDNRIVAPDTDLRKIKTLIYFWTNVIRASVIGTSDHKNPPPIVRFNYGPLYKKVPFVVEKYQITTDENSGVDPVSMLPRRLKFTLNMEEIRVGNFGKHQAYGFAGATLESGDNVAGWEHILSTGSTNPLYHINVK